MTTYQPSAAFHANQYRKSSHKLRTIIIENELDAQSLLSNIIEEYCPALELAGVAASIAEGYDLIDRVKPDLVFLDIEIDGGTSFNILDRWKQLPFKVIFTTAYDHYALKAFKYGATDYLLKPYSPQDILRSLERIRSNQYDEAIFNRIEYLIRNTGTENASRISISTSDGISLVSVNDIIRIEADRSYCFVCLSDGRRILVSKPLKDFEEMLPQPSFYRVHTTHLVNMDFVTRFVKDDGGSIIMTDGRSVPLARRRKQAFLDLLHSI